MKISSVQKNLSLVIVSAIGIAAIAGAAWAELDDDVDDVTDVKIDPDITTLVKADKEFAKMVYIARTQKEAIPEAELEDWDIADEADDAPTPIPTIDPSPVVAPPVVAPPVVAPPVVAPPVVVAPPAPVAGPPACDHGTARAPGTIWATDGKDMVYLRANESGGFDVSINGSVVCIAHPADAGSRMVFHLKDGNDTFLVGPGFSFPVEVWGGSGLDDITGGEGADILHGGLDSDEIRGGGGSDQIEGNGGNDRLYGGKGLDVIEGGGDKDSCVGGRGSDTFAGCEAVTEG